MFYSSQATFQCIAYFGRAVTCVPVTQMRNWRLSQFLSLVWICLLNSVLLSIPLLHVNDHPLPISQGLLMCAKQLWAKILFYFLESFLVIILDPYSPHPLYPVSNCQLVFPLAVKIPHSIYCELKSWIRKISFKKLFENCEWIGSEIPKDFHKS